MYSNSKIQQLHIAIGLIVRLQDSQAGPNCRCGFESRIGQLFYLFQASDTMSRNCFLTFSNVYWLAQLLTTAIYNLYNEGRGLINKQRPAKDCCDNLYHFIPVTGTDSMTSSRTILQIIQVYSVGQSTCEKAKYSNDKILDKHILGHKMIFSIQIFQCQYYI